MKAPAWAESYTVQRLTCLHMLWCKHYSEAGGKNSVLRTIFESRRENVNCRKDNYLYL